MATIDEITKEIKILFPKMIKGVQGILPKNWSISMPQMSLLMAIHEAGGKASISGIAQDRKVSLPTITNMVDRLIRNGLLKRVDDPNDRRKVLAQLTPKGKKAVETMLVAIEKRWHKVLSHLLTEEQVAFLHGIKRMIEVISEIEAPLTPSVGKKRKGADAL
jgi:DNA-binding MarR family transcriptional regulator